VQQPKAARLSWRRAKSCSAGNCVEVAATAGGGVAVRDSKNPNGGILLYTAGEWQAFLGAAKAGEFDNLA
jgi:hypothetical protein